MKRARFVIRLVCVCQVLLFTISSSLVAQQKEDKAKENQPAAQNNVARPRANPFGGADPFGDLQNRLLQQIDPNAPKTLFSVLRRNEVATELGFTRTQVYEAMRKLTEEESAARAEIFSSAKSKSMEARVRFQELEKLESELDAKRLQALEEFLSEEKLQRLKEISLRIMISKHGLANVLSVGELSVNLGLSDQQIAELLAESERLTREKEEKMKELQNEIDQKLLELLSVPQQKKLKEEVGEDFEVQPVQRSGPFDTLRRYREQARASEKKEAKK